jgi:hypothetical protein
MSMHPLETYLKELSEIRSTGGAVPEESYYGALENLLNELGKKLKPKVRCLRQVADTGAGHPDFGLYTADQFQRSRDSQPIPGVLPERGVIEVKGLKDDTWLTAECQQVTRYWGHYNQVLVTNYCGFLLIGRDQDGSRPPFPNNACALTCPRPHGSIPDNVPTCNNRRGSHQ